MVTNSWEDVWSSAGDDVRRRVHAVVRAQGGELAEIFYQALFSDEQAAKLLDHQVVNDRLHRSMAAWLDSLFDPAQALEELQNVQRQTGELHARVGVPMSLVTRGARVLKRALCLRVEAAEPPLDQAVVSVRYVHELIDLAIDLINTAYVKNENRLARADEAYRHFYLTQNLQAERERQRSLLLEWSQAVLLSQYLERGPVGGQGTPPSLVQSPFGLWLQHKATVMFEGMPELAMIFELLRGLDDRVLPELLSARGDLEHTRRIVGEFNDRVDGIKQLLSALFDLVIAGDSMQDGLTRLLHRRYLPTVIKREIAQCQRGQTGFAMALLDLDQFDRMVSMLGAEGAELVLAQVSAMLAEGVRAGDFVFRIGESRFAVLVVEVHAAEAQAIVQALVQHVQAAVFRTTTDVRTQVTLSHGLALYDGHPDYQRLIQRAEAELPRAG